MSSAVHPILPQLEATALPQQPAVLPDDLLAEILVRVASPEDLARASTACISFHRLITDPIFLRRYRSLHPPLFLGLFNVDEDFYGASFQPAEAPLPGAPAGRAIARAADFSFRYVPRGRWGGWWYPTQVYDGRVLLVCCCPDPALKDVALPDLAVCDPLSRRYLLLPPIPDGQSYEQNLKLYCALFAPSVDKDDDEASFRVIMELNCTEELVVAVFSSSSSSWSVCASTNWDALRLSRPTWTSSKIFPSYAYNCLYWKVYLTNKLVQLNMNTKKFSIVDLPPEHEERTIIIVEEGNGMLGMFSDHMYYTTSSAHYYTSVQKEGKIANAWQLKHIIPMPIVDCCYLLCLPQRHIFLKDNCTSRFFTLDFKTMKFERIGTTKCKYSHPYLGYPPSMSPRRI